MADSRPVELSIGTISGNYHDVSAIASWSVRGVKDAITGMTNLSCSEQRLLFGSRVLSDAEILAEFLPSSKDHHEMLLVVCIDQEKADVMTSLVLGSTSLCNVEEKYLDDFDVVEAAVRRNGMDLEHARGAPRRDETLVLAAIAQNGFALSFAPVAFTSNPEAVLLAARSSAFSITLAHDSLQTDCDFAIEAVRANPFVKDYLERCVLDNSRFQDVFGPVPKRKADVVMTPSVEKSTPRAEKKLESGCKTCLPGCLRRFFPHTNLEKKSFL